MGLVRMRDVSTSRMFRCKLQFKGQQQRYEEKMHICTE